MTKKDKLIQKFLKNPTSLHYQEIEKILLKFGFQKIHAKGSHNKFKHPLLQNDLIIPIHNKDCKSFYKKYSAKIVKQYRLYQ